MQLRLDALLLSHELFHASRFFRDRMLPHMNSILELAGDESCCTADMGMAGVLSHQAQEVLQSWYTSFGKKYGQVCQGFSSRRTSFRGGHHVSLLAASQVCSLLAALSDRSTLLAQNCVAAAKA